MGEPDQPRPPSRRAAQGPERTVVAAALLMGLVGSGVVAYLWTLDAYTARPVPFVILLVLFVALEALRVELVIGPNNYAITMSELALVTGVLTARPAEVVVAHVVAVLLVFGILYRLPPPKLAFNAASVAFGTSLGVLVIRAVAGGASTSTRVAVGCVLGGITVGVLGPGALLATSELRGQHRPRRELVRELLTTATSSLATAAIGVQVVFLGRHSAWLALLAIVPMALMYSAFRAYAAQRRLAERSGFLHQATTALHAAEQFEDGLLAVLERTRSATWAELCRLILFTPDGDTTLVAHDDPTRTEPAGPPTPELATAARLLLQGLERTELLGPHDVAGGALLEYLGMHDGIAAPVVIDEQCTGLLVVGNRRGDLDEFRAEDMATMSLVAHQIGVALEKRRMRRTLDHLGQLETLLQHQARHDGLTGVANRRYFNERVEQLFARRSAEGCAVLLIDLDDFKRVNDTFGHPVGDELLVVLSQRLSASVRTADLVARIGGDEFAVVLGGAVDQATVRQRAKAIVGSVRRPVQVNGVMVNVRSSVGAALADAGVSSPEELLQHADTALYRAKELGKDQYVLFDDELGQAETDRRSMTAEVADAVEQHTFSVLYQPVHDLVSGEVVAVEALVRWRHPFRGDLRPAEFLHLVETSGLLVELGEQVIDESARVVAALLGELGSERRLRLHVNIGAQQLAEPHLAPSTVRALARHGLPPERLVLEATELACLADVERTRRASRQLRDAGITLALDDFGVGFSALAQLRELPFDVLKIDTTFVRSLPDDRRTSAMVGAIVHFANALGVTAIAEGIETLEQLDELRRRGCRYGQGFLMTPPLTEPQLHELLLAGGHRPIWAG